MPEYGTDSVAQYVFALVLELCHHVALHDRAVRDGEWTRQPDFSIRKTPLIELAGKTMGIVGYGRIGRRVGELARAFGMDVIAHDVYQWPEDDGRAARRCELDELFARADVISLHSPLTPQTAGLVNRERLMRVKPGALLINTARGPLIVDADLAEALAVGPAGRGGGRRGLRRADPARQPAALGPELPDHPAHRLGDRGGPASAHGRDRRQHRGVPRGTAGECGQLKRPSNPESGGGPLDAAPDGGTIHFASRTSVAVWNRLGILVAWGSLS